MRLVMAIAGAALLACSCASGPIPAPITKSVDSASAATEGEARVGLVIPDQRAVASSVLVAEVDSPDYGWIVIRGLSEGEPGPLLGVAPVRPGNTKSLPVRLSLSPAGSYVAYLYHDRGTRSIFECPGPDEPVLVSGRPLERGFSILN